MAGQQWSKEDRRGLASAARFVSSCLDEWDPIPVYDEPDGPPPGEYDDLVWPVMRLLVNGASAEDIAHELRRGVEGYGIPCPPNVMSVAARLREWWHAKGAAESRCQGDPASALLS